MSSFDDDLQKYDQMIATAPQSQTPQASLNHIRELLQIEIRLARVRDTTNKYQRLRNV
jgi:hypothetical protein